MRELTEERLVVLDALAPAAAGRCAFPTATRWPASRQSRCGRACAAENPPRRGAADAQLRRRQPGASPRAARAPAIARTLRDLGGLALEMYRRDRFREDLLLERCAELIGLEARIHELDALLGSAHARRASRRPPAASAARRCSGARASAPPAAARSPTRRRTGDERRRRQAALPALRRGGRSRAGVLPRVRHSASPTSRRVPSRRASARSPSGTPGPSSLGRAGAARSRRRRPRHAAPRSRSRDDGDEDGVPTATGGSLTVTGGTPTLTAPEPTDGDRSGDDGAASDDRAAARPRRPPRSRGPPGERGWTIVLLSLPQANGRAAAAAQAKKARDGGLRRVGVLDSSRFASLHPGYYVVFQGVYDDEAEATSALQRARAVFPLRTRVRSPPDRGVRSRRRGTRRRSNPRPDALAFATQQTLSTTL